MLTDDHKTKQMDSALKFLTRYAQIGDAFLDSIVTGDKTWGFFTTLLNSSNSHCNGAIRISPGQKIQISISVTKIMTSVFWDRKGILLVDFIPPGETINAAAYCNSLTRLQRAIQNKRRERSCGVCLVHDNVRPHSAHVTTAFLEKFK
jgi:hypothetical protein